MSYNFDFEVSAKISPEVAKDMIRKVIQEQTGKKVASVDMKVRATTKGFGPGESTEYIFDGCTVYFQNEQASTNSSTKPFVKDTY